MMMESLEHMVRNRVRMFLRHTWLVAILGTILIGALIWAGFYYANEREHLRVAASHIDARFVQDNKLTDAGLAEVRRRLPHADLSALEKSRDLALVPNLFAVQDIVDYLQRKFG